MTSGFDLFLYSVFHSAFLSLVSWYDCGLKRDNAAYLALNSLLTVANDSPLCFKYFSAFNVLGFFFAFEDFDYIFTTETHITSPTTTHEPTKWSLFTVASSFNLCIRQQNHFAINLKKRRKTKAKIKTPAVIVNSLICYEFRWKKKAQITHPFHSLDVFCALICFHDWWWMCVLQREVHLAFCFNVKICDASKVLLFNLVMW